MKIKHIKGKFVIHLLHDLCCEMSFDEDLEIDKKEESDSISSRVQFIDQLNGEKMEYIYAIPFDMKIDNLQDIFKKIMWQIAKRWKDGCLFERITDCNPECAWLFYKKTFDKVMSGVKIWEMSDFSMELTLEDVDGTQKKIRYCQKEIERLFWEDMYLGRVDMKACDHQELVYSDCEMEEIAPPLFLCDTKKEEKLSGGKYTPLFESNNLFLEAGIHIYHKGTFYEILQGLIMATEKFLELRNEK